MHIKWSILVLNPPINMQQPKATKTSTQQQNVANLCYSHMNKAIQCKNMHIGCVVALLVLPVSCNTNGPNLQHTINKVQNYFVIKIKPTRVTVVLYLFNDHQNLLIWCQFDNLITLSMHCDPTYDYTMGDSMDSTIAGQTNGSNIRLVHRTHTCDGSTCSVHRCK